MVVYLLCDVSEAKELLSVHATKEAAEIAKQAIIDKERLRAFSNAWPKVATDQIGWWLEIKEWEVLS